VFLWAETESDPGLERDCCRITRAVHTVEQWVSEGGRCEVDPLVLFCNVLMHKYRKLLRPESYVLTAEPYNSILEYFVTEPNCI
jgi:hypothetical protein